MRTIKFVISGQSIKNDPSCDFSGIVPVTSGYLRAEFTFDADEIYNYAIKIEVLQ